MVDLFGRTIDYMRISITDRCNLRCRYCMPEGISKIPMKEILTYENIEEICRAAAALGIRKFKITGGEPLVRRDVAVLVRRICGIPGAEQVTLTTNGILLEEQLAELVSAGLCGLNVSLDTLDPVQYEKITGADALKRVLRSIDEAYEAGIPVKINAVLQKNMNADAWKDLILLAKERKMDVRFIEMMPIGYGRRFSPVYGEEVLEKIRALYPDIVRDTDVHGNGPAVYYRVPGWKGSIGFISAVHGKFCPDCNRLRLTSTGKIKPCLCYADHVDLMPVFREETDPFVRQDRLQRAVEEAVRRKPKAHCFEALSEVTEKRKMAEIGG